VQLVKERSADVLVSFPVGRRRTFLNAQGTVRVIEQTIMRLLYRQFYTSTDERRHNGYQNSDLRPPGQQRTLTGGSVPGQLTFRSGLKITPEWNLCGSRMLRCEKGFGGNLQVRKIAFALVMLSAVFIVSGCGHKLVGHNGETTVSVFNSKKDFDNVMSMKSRGGVSGLAGGVGENLVARKIPQDANVKILSSDSEGYEIEVLEGAEAGLRGYVAKDNVE
jgi:hypothetical protein